MSNNGHFKRLWESVQQAISDSFEECDPEFLERCNVQRIYDRNHKGTESKYEEAVEDAYRMHRGELRHECYGPAKRDDEDLDSRKVAAVICCALIDRKAISFDYSEASKMLQEKAEEYENDRKALNK